MSSPVMARKSYGLDWPCTQGRSGPADTVFQSVFRQFGRAVDAQSAANRIHPTAKPVELIERALLNSSKAGDVVSATVKIVCRPVHYYFGFGPSVICTRSPGRIHLANAACTCWAVIAAYRFAA